MNESFVNFKPGSDAAIVASLADAYEAGEAWVGYYWSPTAVTAKYDLTLLQEPEYDPEVYEKRKQHKHHQMMSLLLFIKMFRIKHQMSLIF